MRQNEIMHHLLGDEHNISSVFLLLKIHNLNFIMSQTQSNYLSSSEGHSMNNWFKLFKCLDHEIQGKTEAVPN